MESVIFSYSFGTTGGDNALARQLFKRLEAEGKPRSLIFSGYNFRTFLCKGLSQSNQQQWMVLDWKHVPEASKDAR